MEYIPDYSDERLKGMCAQCGQGLSRQNCSSDHAPSRCLLREPYPLNLPVIPTCTSCNTRSSKDEEYLFLFLQCVLVGSTDPSNHADAKVRRALQRQSKLRSRIERSKAEVLTLFGETELIWIPEEARVNQVVLKNARGHAYYEIGQPVLHEPDYVWARPLATLTRDQHLHFEGPLAGSSGSPEVGSRVMTRWVTGQDLLNGWVMVQDETYRYRVEQFGGFLVRSVLHEYLVTEVYWEGKG